MYYRVTLTDNFFPQHFEAQVEAKSQTEAIEIVREHYAQELGTYPEDLEVISVEAIRGRGRAPLTR